MIQRKRRTWRTRTWTQGLVFLILLTLPFSYSSPILSPSSSNSKSALTSHLRSTLPLSDEMFPLNDETDREEEEGEEGEIPSILSINRPTPPRASSTPPRSSIVTNTNHLEKFPLNSLTHSTTSYPPSTDFWARNSLWKGFMGHLVTPLKNFIHSFHSDLDRAGLDRSFWRKQEKLSKISMTRIYYQFSELYSKSVRLNFQSSIYMSMKWDWNATYLPDGIDLWNLLPRKEDTLESGFLTDLEQFRLESKLESKLDPNVEPGLPSRLESKSKSKFDPESEEISIPLSKVSSERPPQSSSPFNLTENFPFFDSSLKSRVSELDFKNRDLKIKSADILLSFQDKALHHIHPMERKLIKLSGNILEMIRDWLTNELDDRLDDVTRSPSKASACSIVK